MSDGLVNNPMSALRFIARLDLGLFTKPSIRMAFYEFIKAERF
jgi:hypothetical protein